MSYITKTTKVRLKNWNNFEQLKEGSKKLIDWKEKLTIIEPNRRRVAQLGSATGLGPVGRRFKSYLADHLSLFFHHPILNAPLAQLDRATPF